jgi:hypothetical protein
VRKLTLWDTYSREEVHGIFSSHTPFTPQAGTWGLQGIVAIPDRPRSYVFFVTFGQRQGDHKFDESITEDGVLTWQSQPRQRLGDSTIKQLIDHDDRIDAIHLFLRTAGNAPYVYCGTLGYLAHDAQREQPVHFQWQLMDWPPPGSILSSLGIEPTSTAAPRSSRTGLPVTGQLIEATRPAVVPRGARSTGTFATTKQAVHPNQDARNAALGLAGERLVLTAERDRLIAAGRDDLAKEIVHVAVVEGDAAGYDIRSYETNGDLRLLEVKTTRGPATTAFYVTPNELAFSRSNPTNYVLIRVFGYDDATDSGRYYEARGPLDDSYELVASEYRAKLT